jgi:hypothetical protein
MYEKKSDKNEEGVHGKKRKEKWAIGSADIVGGKMRRGRARQRLREGGKMKIEVRGV